MKTTVFEFRLDKDLELFGLQAPVFPDEVKRTHEKLHALVSFNPVRTYAGLSNFLPEGGLEYHAAASEISKGEFEKLALRQYNIKAGLYLCTDILDFMNHIDQIGDAFASLTSDERWDSSNWAVELYMNDTCRCMVRLKD